MGRARGEAWSALGICIWFGIAAGLTERVAYRFVPGYLGPVELYYSALLDFIVFSLLWLPALAISLAVRRWHASFVATFLCSALLTLDLVSILLPPHHKFALLATATAVAALLTMLLAKLTGVAGRLMRMTLFVGVVYAVVYLAVLPTAQTIEERKQTAGATNGKPNVLLIIVDALRADHLSAYGYHRVTSPNLDRLATQGVLFENAVAPSSWTLPSHASILTGRPESEHHAGESKWYLDTRYPILGTAFERLGYRTAAFSGNPYVFTRRVGMGRGFMHFEDGSILERFMQTNLGKHVLNQIGLYQLSDDIIGRQNAQTIGGNALRWIRRGGKPFFVVINFYDVHEPTVPSPELMMLYSSRPAPRGQIHWPLDVQLSPQQVTDVVDSYDACIHYTDEQIAAFLDGLRRSGFLDNTIVVITSDHGQAFNEQGFMFHGKALYWNLIHSPLIVWAREKAPAGVRVSTAVSLQAIPATLLDLVGAENREFPGESLRSLWQEPPRGDWPYPVSELGWLMQSPRFPSYYGPMTSVVADGWHYIQGGQFGSELYRCCGGETLQQNLAQSPQDQQIVTRFHSAMRTGTFDQPAYDSFATTKTTAEQPLKTMPAPADREEARKRMNDALRALGYQQ